MTPLPSSFDEFEQHQRFFDLIEAHRATLAAEAIRVAREQPGARLVGLILDGESREAAAFRTAMGATPLPPGAPFVGIVLRRMAFQLVGEDEASDQEWLSDEGGGATRWLPVVFVAKDGFRWGRVEYRADGTA